MQTTVIKVNATLSGSKQPLILGKQGENGVREYIFDVYDLIDAFGDGIGTILLLRPDDDAPYPVKSQQAGGMIGWIVSDVDTNQSGACCVELRWETSEGGVAKSVTYHAKVLASPSFVSDLPAGDADWISEVIRSGKDAASAATEAAEAAVAATEASVKAASAASTAGKDSADAKKAAEDAREYGTEAIALYDSVFDVLTSQKGYFATPEDLRRSYPVGIVGWWAIVGSADTIWVWDDSTGTWVDTHKNTDLSNYYTKDETSSIVLAAKQALLPVGSIYTWSPRSGGPDLSTPAKLAAYLGFGTWEAVEGRRVLMSATASHPAGTTAEAGLPEIAGYFNNALSVALYDTGDAMSGPFMDGARSRWFPVREYDTDGEWNAGLNFRASNANPIYGASSTVQPPALFVYMYQRVA